MRRTYTRLLGALCLIVFVAACNTIKNLPTNTTGGLFSLNGSWQLTSSTDSKAMEGSTITVYPVIGNGTLKTISNNTYCLQEGSQIWQNIKSNNTGGFNLKTMVSACDGRTVTRDATITIVNDNEVALTSRTAGGTELIQQWKRISTK